MVKQSDLQNIPTYMSTVGPSQVHRIITPPKESFACITYVRTIHMLVTGHSPLTPRHAAPRTDGRGAEIIRHAAVRKGKLVWSEAGHTADKTVFRP